MSTEQSFLDAVCESPGDDAPRLVFADWLEDNGQPQRADFIRTQVRLAGMDAHDPGRAELERREWLLLRAHGKEWGRAAARFGKRFGFVRGFVGRMTLESASFLKQADRIAARVPLTHLCLLTADKVDDLAQCEGLSKLLALELRSSALGATGTVTLAGCEHLANLRELVLSTAYCRDRGARAVLRSPHLRNLRTLRLNRGDLTAGFLADLAAAELPHLRALGLSGSRALMDASALNNVGWLGQLEELSLAGVPLGDEGVARLAESERWAGLQKLDLSRSRLGDTGADALAQSPHLGNLIDLRLLGAIGFNVLGNVAGSPHLHRLRVLDVRESLGPVSGWVRKLADSPMADSLRELRLPPLAQMQGRGLLEVQRLRGLQVLDLHGYAGGGFDLACYLAGASHLTQLRELVLSKCQLHSDALAELAKAPHLASLTHLDLSGNWIEANGFAALMESPHLANLRRLVVRGNPGAQGADGRRLIDRFGADVCEGVTG